MFRAGSRVRGAFFGPEITSSMASAFDAAWQQLEISESRLIAQAGVTRTRNVLAKIVVELAIQGVRDQQELCSHALAHLRATQRSMPELTGSGDRMLH